MPAQRGPRGEKVTIVTWTDPAVPHDLHIEAYAAAGVRPSVHPSAAQRVKELREKNMVVVGCDTVPVK